MSEFDNVRVEIDSELLKKADVVFKSMGYTVQEAFELFVNWTLENREKAKRKILEWQEEEKKTVRREYDIANLNPRPNPYRKIALNHKVFEGVLKSSDDATIGRTEDADLCSNTLLTKSKKG